MKKYILCVSFLLLTGTVSRGQEDVLQAETIGDESSTILSHGRWSLAGRFLEETEEYVIDALAPLWMREDSRLFLNLRGSLLGDEEQEVNAGMVARQKIDRIGSVVGLNAFYDSRWTEHDNRFDQVGAGLEIMSRWVDVRANYYYPITDEFILGESSSSERETSGSRRIDTSSVYRNYEEALEGYDAEMGVWLPWISRYVPTAVFAGYYEFKSDLVEDDLYRGVKARVELRVHPNITLDGEWFEEDALNQSEYIVGIRVHVPFDFWRSTRLQSPSGPYHAMENRMSEFVHRDFRIRTIETGPVLFARSTSESVGGQNPPPAPLPPPIVCRDEFVTDPVTGTISVVTICE